MGKAGGFSVTTYHALRSPQKGLLMTPPTALDKLDEGILFVAMLRRPDQTACVLGCLIP